MKLKLRKIEIEGFRAFREKTVIEFDDVLTVICGPQGSGKTSIVRAIEFALFGITREVSARSLRKEDLVNDFCDKARVSLTLVKDSGEEVTIERVLTRRGGVKLRLLTDGKELRDEKGNEYLAALISIPLEDYTSLVAPSLTELYSMIYSPPSVRDRLIDRLVGIGEVERLYRELSGREIRGYMDALKGELQRLGGANLVREYEKRENELKMLEKREEEIRKELNRLEARRRMLEDQLVSYAVLGDELERLMSEKAKLEAELESIGGEQLIRLPAVDEGYLLAYAEKVREDLARLLEELYLSRDAVAIREIALESVNDIHKLLSEFNKIIKKINEMIIRIEYDVRDAYNEVRNIENEVRRIEEELIKIEYKINELKDSKVEYDSILKKFGDRESISKRAAQLEIQLKAMRAEIERSSCVKRLQEAILDSLKTHGSASCPVCGSEVVSAINLPRVGSLESLERRVHELERELNDIKLAERRLTRLEPDLRLLLEYEERHEDLERLLNEKLDELEEARTRAEELELRWRSLKKDLGNLIVSFDKLNNMMVRYKAHMIRNKINEINIMLKEKGYDEKKIKDLKENLDRINKRIYNLNGMLNEISNNRERILAELERMKTLINNLKILEAKYKRIETLHNTIIRIRSLLRDIHVDLRKRLAESLSQRMTAIFNLINIYGGFSEVKVEVTEEGRGKQGHYVIYVRRESDGRLTPAATRLSDGQRALLALSLMLAARGLRPSNLAFLILDDPVPNVDERTKLSLAKALESLEKGVQVVLTTQSFALAERLADIAKVYITDRPAEAMATPEKA